MNILIAAVDYGPSLDGLNWTPVGHLPTFDEAYGWMDEDPGVQFMQAIALLEELEQAPGGIDGGTTF